MTDLFDREAKESRNMTRGTEVLEGFWVGNDCDVPGGADDGAGATVDFDLCVRASECCDMPTTSNLNLANKKLVDLDKKKKRQQRNLQLKLGINTTPGKTDHDSRSPGQSWLPSPATIALRNLLSASPSSSTTTESGLKRVASPTPQDKNRYNRPRTRSTDREEQEQVAQEEADKPTREYISIDCAGSCRTFTGQMRNLHVMTERVIELVTFLRKQIEGKEKRKVLVHCQDGYTESSIIVLAYIMASMSISLPEAFLHLQQNANRSFFLYPSDKPLLRRIDDVLFLERRKKAKLLIESTADTPSSSPERSTSPTESISSLASGKSNTGTSPSTFGSNLTSRDKWRSWSFFGAMPRSEDATRSQLEAQEAEALAKEKEKALQLALGVVAEQDAGGSAATKAARQWFDDGRFDGFPSRILPFLYLGNM
jgi:dual specificity MAP kinase phosphatase